jgi:hypothetical protein
MRMNEKLLIPVLAIAFLMLTTPVLASGATTWHFVGKGALSMNLYNPGSDIYMILDVIRSKDPSTPKYETQMLASVYDSSGVELWFAVKDLGKGEFTWSMDHATLSTAVDYFGVPTPLTAQWQAIGPTVEEHSNDNTSPYHIVFNGLLRDASATATLDGLTFYYIPNLSWATLTLNAEVTITKS